MHTNADAARIVELSLQLRKLGDTPAEVLDGSHTAVQSAMSSTGYELAGLFLEALQGHREADEPPVAVLVPVGILERAGAVADEASGEACSRSHGDAEIAREEELHRLARALYAAGRGEAVDWSAV